MDKKTINLVIEKFNDIYFKNIHQIIESNFNFFDEFHLVFPKKNYLFTYKYLNYVYNNFTRIDDEFMSLTLKKLQRDIENIEILYVEYEKIEVDLQIVFDKSFLKKSKLFTYMQIDLKNLKEENRESNREEIKEIKHQLKELKKIYYNLFEKDFLEQNRYVLKDLKEILNSKVYYFDRLLWKDAMTSQNIRQKLLHVKIKKGDESKSYLKELLNVVLPYSDNYKYFQKCLKVYR